MLFLSFIFPVWPNISPPKVIQNLMDWVDASERTDSQKAIRDLQNRGRAVEIHTFINRLASTVPGYKCFGLGKIDVAELVKRILHIKLNSPEYDPREALSYVATKFLSQEVWGPWKLLFSDEQDLQATKPWFTHAQKMLSFLRKKNYDIPTFVDNAEYVIRGLAQQVGSHPKATPLIKNLLSGFSRFLRLMGHEDYAKTLAVFLKAYLDDTQAWQAGYTSREERLHAFLDVIRQSIFALEEIKVNVSCGPGIWERFLINLGVIHPVAQKLLSAPTGFQQMVTKQNPYANTKLFFPFFQWLQAHHSPLIAKLERAIAKRDTIDLEGELQDQYFQYLIQAETLQKEGVTAYQLIGADVTELTKDPSLQDPQIQAYMRENQREIQRCLDSSPEDQCQKPVLTQEDSNLQDPQVQNKEGDQSCLDDLSGDQCAEAIKIQGAYYALRNLPNYSQLSSDQEEAKHKELLQKFDVLRIRIIELKQDEATRNSSEVRETSYVLSKEDLQLLQDYADAMPLKEFIEQFKIYKGLYGEPRHSENPESSMQSSTQGEKESSPNLLEEESEAILPEARIGEEIIEEEFPHPPEPSDIHQHLKKIIDYTHGKGRPSKALISEFQEILNQGAAYLGQKLKKISTLKGAKQFAKELLEKVPL